MNISNRRQTHSMGAVTAPSLTAHTEPEPGTKPTSSWSEQKKHRVIDGTRMAYYEAGEGDPIVFLHGNPTSSYLWRKVIPHVQHLGRCIAPDMVGMGDSEPLPNSGPGVYTYLNHRKYLYALLEELGVQRNAVFVIHDWGSAMGFNWAMLNPDKVKGIAYMEAIVRPFETDEASEQGDGFFGKLRSSDGEKLVLEQNFFVEKMLLDGLKYFLAPEDIAEYRRPYLEPGESRRPTLTWPREVPINGEPVVNETIIRDYSTWLIASSIPKLFIRAVPGAIFRLPEMLKIARSFKNQQEIVVYGGHFLQEVSGDAIGRALAQWIPTLA